MMSYDDDMSELAQEYYPGSSRKIEAVPDAPGHGPDDADRWDAKPRIHKYNGEDTEFFTIGHLAAAMGRKPLTIRQWERKGIIPKSTFQRAGKDGSQHGRRRLYTRAQIEGMIVIADEEGMLINDRREIAKTQFSPRVRELFEKLARNRR